MLNVLRSWIHRYFSDEEAVVLGVLLVVAFATVLTLGHMLAPVIAGLVLAYLMQGLVGALERIKLPHLVAVWLVFLMFIGLLTVCILFLAPLMWQQVLTLFNELPRMLVEWQSLLLLLPERLVQQIAEKIVDTIDINCTRRGSTIPLPFTTFSHRRRCKFQQHLEPALL